MLNVSMAKQVLHTVHIHCHSQEAENYQLVSFIVGDQFVMQFLLEYLKPAKTDWNG